MNMNIDNWKLKDSCNDTQFYYQSKLNDDIIACIVIPHKGNHFRWLLRIGFKSTFDKWDNVEYENTFNTFPLLTKFMSDEKSLKEIESMKGEEIIPPKDNKIMRERIYIMVADYCLIEAIKKFNDSGCDGIELGKVGDNWIVSYYKEPVECYQDDELEQNETKLTREELEKEAEEYINTQRNLITQEGIIPSKE